jgi:hypothetical protein
MDNLFEYLRDTLGPRQAAIEDVQRKVANGGTPYGVLSALGGRPYAAMFLGHGAGRLPIYPANREVALREREVAKAALGRTVVVDPTTLVVASFTDGLFQLLQGEFQSLTTTDAAVADVVATMEHNARGDGLTIGWDNALGQAVVNQEDPDSLSERRRRARVSADWARNDLRRVAWRAQQALATPVDGPTHDSDSRFWSWLSGLDYAKANGLPFLCDDAALRQVAR